MKLTERWAEWLLVVLLIGLGVEHAVIAFAPEHRDHWVTAVAFFYAAWVKYRYERLRVKYDTDAGWK